MRKLIIIEDDIVLRNEFKKFLISYGYEVKAPESFENIIDYVKKEKGELILLDINLPFFDGYYICREIRKDSNIPIIVVTSRDSDMDELMSINLGADDFITKPYNTQILLARIESLMKRVYGNDSIENIVQYKNLSLNLSNAAASYKDKIVELTKNEMKILSYLKKNKGNIVSREELMTYLWKGECFVDDST